MKRTGQKEAVYRRKPIATWQAGILCMYNPLPLIISLEVIARYRIASDARVAFAWADENEEAGRDRDDRLY